MPAGGFCMDRSYDTRLQATEYTNFFPYIGVDYNLSSPRILVLGHSTYAAGTDDESVEKWDQYTERIRELIEDDYLNTLADTGRTRRYVRCFRNMAAVLAGKGYGQSDSIWNSLAFHNFFQKHVGNSPENRHWLTDELRVRSQKALFEVISILSPDIVIAWGKELWYHDLPQNDWEWIHEDIKIYRYTEHPQTWFWGIMHPSARMFSIDTVRERWIEVLNFYTLHHS